MEQKFHHKQNLQFKEKELFVYGTATFDESLGGDEFELYKNDGKGITYYRSKKAMKIEY